jgi:transcriptional regulator with XRE-family HTH domain
MFMDQGVVTVQQALRLATPIQNAVEMFAGNAEMAGGPTLAQGRDYLYACVFLVTRHSHLEREIILASRKRKKKFKKSFKKTDCVKNRVKEVRESKGMTLEHVEAALNKEWSLKTVGNVENDRYEPSDRLIMALARVLGTEEKTLFPDWTPGASPGYPSNARGDADRLEERGVPGVRVPALDPETQAMNVIIKAMQGLSPEVEQRVVEWVVKRWGKERESRGLKYPKGEE